MQYSKKFCIFAVENRNTSESRKNQEIVDMKVTLLKLTRKKEVVKRLEPQALADMIRNNPEERKVFNLRLHYQFMKPTRMDDGQVTIDSDTPAFGPP